MSLIYGSRQDTSNYKIKASKDVVHSIKTHGLQRDEKNSDLYYVIKVQSAWRRRVASSLYTALQQEKKCRSYQTSMRNGLNLDCEACLDGKKEIELEHASRRRAFREIESLLFRNNRKVTVKDTGENWNARFQEALEMSENTEMEQQEKLHALSAVNQDFVAAAVAYGRTIISEYFLHVKDKSIRPTKIGGIAGGRKYLWRGILFKLADGTTGPWTGSDEAAAKAAGHDLRGATTYFNLKIPGLHFALVALIDYKGFRMTAQAWLPLRRHSLMMGSADAGRTVVNRSIEDPALARRLQQSAHALNLREHYVGNATEEDLLPFACDMEAHSGADGRCYLLDFGRFMPPECPRTMAHLTNILSDGTKVAVHRGNGEYSYGIVERTLELGTLYDIYFPPGKVCHNVPASQIRDENMSIFWRLLRPEFVRHRGRPLWEELGLLWPPESSNGVAPPPPLFDSGKEALEAPGTPIPSQAQTAGALSGSPGHSPGEGCSSGEGNVSTDDHHHEADALPVVAGSHDATGTTFVPRSPAGGAAGLGGRSTGQGQGGYGYAGYGYFGEGAGLGSGASSLAGEEGAATAAAAAAATREQEGTTEEQVPLWRRPLSPDAFSIFSRGDPGFAARNKEVEAASKFLVKAVLPHLATHLAWMCCDQPQRLRDLSLSTELHRFGVNLRHLGLLRALVPDYAAHRPLRDKLLVEIVARTLKNLLRDFQRKWMKSQQSTSEQGINAVVAAFLNLVTGAHGAASEFWDERVVTGVLQRFGHVGLTNWERKHLQFLMSEASRLKHLVQALLHMAGVRLGPAAEHQFASDPRPRAFEFVGADVLQVAPLVKYMHVIDFMEGELLAAEVDRRTKLDPETTLRTSTIISRLKIMASNSYHNAHKSMPDCEETKKRLDLYESFKEQHWDTEKSSVGFHTPPTWQEEEAARLTVATASAAEKAFGPRKISKKSGASTPPGWHPQQKQSDISSTMVMMQRQEQEASFHRGLGQQDSCGVKQKEQLPIQNSTEVVPSFSPPPIIKKVTLKTLQGYKDPEDHCL